MHGLLRMVATLLLLTMTATVPGMGAMPFAVAPAEHASGCHSHRPANPSHVPTGYQCCVNGHHVAVPSASFSLYFVAAEVESLESGNNHRLALPLGLNSAGFNLPSSSPPDLSPLRI
jgi:hypothetical protein